MKYLRRVIGVTQRDRIRNIESRREVRSNTNMKIAKIYRKKHLSCGKIRSIWRDNAR